ncbi:Site-specific recombinase XerD [Halogeometricum rufum]|uniref:Site-specific recombinase XerD n=1 Tax=Halogeometricum rufum TaxID=553469 RepID=A0A1I6JA64_9EURY|nr:site-specific integrase [Halogeometricum rufum]SFR75877.1 Site-specific recombinase XerD [Halogeometricum rufum]
MSDTNDLEPIDPPTAVEMYLQERSQELADASHQAHRYRLNHFLRWCEEVEHVDNLNELTGRKLHQYRLWRREDGDLSNVSLKTQMDTLRVFVRFCERIDAVTRNLHEAVVSPSLSPGEDHKEVMLESDDAEELLAHLERFEYASFQHAMFTLLWHTGMRLGAIRSIDVNDYDPTQSRVRLRHRPAEDTPLKNGNEGERLIALRQEICDVLDDWIAHRRPDVTDAYGREPLFSTTQGRASRTTVRETVYRLTRPCEFTGDCPHGREIADCEATNDAQKTASKCPSSVSPHDVRRGSITYFLTRDVPEKVVSDRMNVGQQVLGKHYDQRTEEQKVEQRRGYLTNI